MISVGLICWHFSLEANVLRNVNMYPWCLNSRLTEILPSTYMTPLYFTPEQLQLLKGSPVLSRFMLIFTECAGNLFQKHLNACFLTAVFYNYACSSHSWLKLYKNYKNLLTLVGYRLGQLLWVIVYILCAPLPKSHNFPRWYLTNTLSYVSNI